MSENDTLVERLAQHLTRWEPDDGYPAVMGYCHGLIAEALAALRDGSPASVPDTTAWAADHLRGLGWTVVEPVDPAAAIPEAKVGQVWVSPSPRVQARTVVKIGPSRGWGSNACVHFTVPKPGEFDQPTSSLNPDGWRAWVRKSNARPLPTPTNGTTP